jgi:Protein of unknown function (DUF1573)
MHIRAKIFLVVAFIAAVASRANCELAFEKTELELHPTAGDETAVGHFKYQNKGDKPIAIKSVTTSCGCTAASAKNSADPGEKGEVTATFKIGDRIGTQQKAINVVTDDPTHPTTTLMLKVIIPQVLQLQPAFLFWQAGEPAKSKAIVAKAGKDISIKNLDVSSSSPDFVAKVEPGSAAGEFRINIEPKQTSQAIATTLTIKPVLPNGKPKVFYASARVMPQSPAAGQSASPPTVGTANTVLAAASKAESNKMKMDACSLLTSKEIESVQGEALKEPKSSGQTGGGFAVSQCYFGLPTSSNSISLTLMQKNDSPDARDPKEFWKETFRGEKNEKKGREEGEEKATPPEKIDGVGDDAFWLGNRVGGELYVLKGNSFFRISVGGAGDKATKIDKSKKLAQMVLKRL